MAAIPIQRVMGGDETPSPMAGAAAAGPAPGAGSPSSQRGRSTKRARVPRRDASKDLEDELQALKDAIKKEKKKSEHAEEKVK